MGFMDDIAGQALGKITGSNPQAAGMAGALMEMINKYPGGLPALIKAFQDKGLGGVVGSWVGTGQNQPISADQVKSVLGDSRIQELATKAGVSPDAASGQIAQMLPGLVDKITPDGNLPDVGGILKSVLG